MSMRPVPWPEADPQVAAAIGAIYGSRKTERPLAVQARDRLGEWLGDEAFAAVFGVRGRPGWSPSRLALVTVLQKAVEARRKVLAADPENTQARMDLATGLEALGLVQSELSQAADGLKTMREALGEEALQRAAQDLRPAAGRDDHGDLRHTVFASCRARRYSSPAAVNAAPSPVPWEPGSIAST